MDGLIFQRLAAAAPLSTLEHHTSAFALSNSASGSWISNFQLHPMFSPSITVTDTADSSASFYDQQQFSQFISQSIYEPIDDHDDDSSAASASCHPIVALTRAAFHDGDYYYQAETFMKDSSVAEPSILNRDDRGAQLAEVADKHMRHLQYLQNSYQLNAGNGKSNNCGAASVGVGRKEKKKSKKSKKRFK